MQPLHHPGLSAAIDREWLQHKKYYFLISFLLPITPLLLGLIALQLHQGWWFWGILPIGYLLLPLLDQLLGKDQVNPSAEQSELLKQDKFYVYILYGIVLMNWLSLIGTGYIISHAHWRWFEIAGAALSIGLINGVALTAGHELGHKVTDKGQTLAGKLVLACCAYGHFIVEHNKGHHKNVATPEDPASSRMGESIYQFVQREIPGTLKRALGLEAQRLQRQGKPWWSLQNEILQQWLLALSVFAIMIACWGVVMLPFLLISCAFGWWQLTSANYVEHYGLLRQKDEQQRYLRCEPRHSWNSNFKLSNLLLVHLQRHSDHHAHPTRPYQTLLDYDDIPQLPQGYFGMFLIALIPSWWFAVMNPRVVNWAHGDMNLVNIDPAQREVIFARYHHPFEQGKA